MPPPWAVHLPPGIGAEDVDLLAAGTLPAAWVARWRAEPDRAVIHDAGSGWISAGELLARTAALAGRLAAAGLVRGDRVVVSGPSSAAFVVAHVACLRAGLAVMPANPAATEREVAGLVALGRPRAALVDGPGLQEALAGAGGHDLLVAGLDGPSGDEGDGDDAADVDLDGVTPDDIALLVSTSGTTGAPKGVPLSHGNLLASGEALRLAWRWTPADRLILCLPLFHVHGLAVGLHGTLLAGASARLHPRFDPEAVLAAAAGDATLLFGVPTMYARLEEADGVGRLGGLRLCVSGSAPLDADRHRRIAARTGQVILERYGMTETIMLVSNPYDGERRAGTVGFPLPGVDVRLDDASGEILVRGPNVFGGYLDASGARRPATEDGWFRTGDVGEHDGDGYLRIVGRTKELIISGGFNVYPREVEDVLRAHPSVVDVAVVGTPSSEWGEVVTAYVEPGEGFDADALAGWAAAQLAPHKRPRRIETVDALPRNALGKVVRERLGSSP